MSGMTDPRRFKGGGQFNLKINSGRAFKVTQCKRLVMRIDKDGRRLFCLGIPQSLSLFTKGKKIY